MASIINATTTGITVTGDNSGQLTLSANGSTALTANTAGHCTFTNNFASVAGYPAYQCRAWVNFNGTSTVAIRSSGNVSSITDNGVGNYTANFTTNMPDANYAATIGANINSSNDDTRRTTRVITWSTSSVSVLTGDTSGGANTKEDYEFVTIAVFR